MSVALTEAAVVDRSKTVTRRLGWRFAKPGDRITLCRKVMGRKGEPLVRLAEVELVSVRRERLLEMDPTDVRKEGFPDWTATQFIDYFCEHMGCNWQTFVTRLEWRYLDAGMSR
jgi:hypothetical protein